MELSNQDKRLVEIILFQFGQVCPPGHIIWKDLSDQLQLTAEETLDELVRIRKKLA